MSNSYVYVYLDTRKLGKYQYNDICFLYEPFYIGQGRDRRYRKHLLESKKGNKMNNSFKFNIINLILEEGKEPIILKLYENISEDTAKEIEVKLIEIIGKRIDGKGPLTNITNGGDGTSGYVLTEDHKKRLSESAKGRKHTDEYKQYMSEKMSGRKLSKEHCENIAKSKTGKKASIETKKLLSELRSGENHPNWGKHHSDETKNKISNTQKGRKMSDKQYKNYLESRKNIDLSGEKNGMFGMTNEKNPNAKIVILTSPYGEEIRCVGNYVKTVKELGLPYNKIRESLKNNGELIKTGKAKGWSAKYEN